MTNNPQVISFETFYRTEYGPMVALATAVRGQPALAKTGGYQLFVGEDCMSADGNSSQPGGVTENFDVAP